MTYQTTTFPTTIDVPVNPISTDPVNTFDHAGLEDFQNNAIATIEAKVGVNSSAVTTSHDYKLSGVTGTDKAVSKTGSEVLTNKTLTTPTIADLTNATHTHQNTAGGGQLNATSVFSAGTIPTARLGSGTANATTFLRGDQTYATVTGAGTVVTIVPHPNYVSTNASAATAVTGNTTLELGQVTIPFNITVNKISIAIGAHTTNGTLKIAMFSEDGQTQYFSVTTASITGTGIVTTAISAISIPTGVYWIAILPVSTLATQPNRWTTNTTTSTNLLRSGVASEPVIEGVLTVTADTMPATITPTSVSATNNVNTMFRLDN